MEAILIIQISNNNSVNQDIHGGDNLKSFLSIFKDRIVFTDRLAVGCDKF